MVNMCRVTKGDVDNHHLPFSAALVLFICGLFNDVSS